MMKTKSIMALLSIVLLSFSVQAKDVKILTEGATPEEMAAILFGSKKSSTDTPKPAQGISRSFGFTKKPSPINVASEPLSAEALGLPIQFVYNSTDMLPKSKSLVDSVGKMLVTNDYSDKKLVVEGHTDSAGSSDYNRFLSKGRAKMVKNYLVANFNISESRLLIKGKGEDEPLPNLDAADPTNRRVQFYETP